MASLVGMAPLVRMAGVQKHFGGVRALGGASFELRAGEVHVLLGENGAGKSTLMKVLSGALSKDAGEVTIDGEPHEAATPVEASARGVRMIHQELQLVPAMTVTENLSLGTERTTLGVVDTRATRAAAADLMKRVGAKADLDAEVRTLSIAEQQLVEIAKSIRQPPKVLIMDEPTAALAEAEIATLFSLVRSLTAQGVGVVYISHRMKELFEIGDRVTVMRDGETVGTRELSTSTESELVELMIGRKLEGRPARAPRASARAALTLENATTDRVGPVSLSVREGEILGIGGLMGSGRSRLVKMLFGVEPLVGGSMTVGGAPRVFREPRDAMAADVACVTEDRKILGLVLGRNVQENVTLASLDSGKEHLASFGVTSPVRERSLTSRFIDLLRIKVGGGHPLVRTLSGGNQQKVVLAKWLARAPKLLVLDEPTRGVDVGAKEEIHSLIESLAAQGTAVVLVSSELPELLSLSDRVVVMRDRRVAGELSRAEATQERVMNLALGLA